MIQTLTMFFKCFSLDGTLRNSLNKGINYLAENWDSIDHKVNPHSLALVTYALHLALHPEKDQVGLYFPYTSHITFCKCHLTLREIYLGILTTDLGIHR